MITEEIRSYEVSVWTLQDEFITVLKWSDIEQKGTIENPKMTLNIDGTQNFEFSIPMYYYYKGKLIDNPNWYNTQNGNLIEGMRKIKVIFNKKTADECVLEFLIINTEETHEKDQPMCNIKCEGLAFHELGKIGYKISLSQENFEQKYKEWAESSDSSLEEPIASLDYWCGNKDACNLERLPVNESDVDPNTWYYTVMMNYNSYKNVASARVGNKIYEEPYPTSWSTNLTPGDYEYYKEKERIVSIDKSNLYNITQTIAEAFQVHCAYRYTHDENYHITSRTIIFYNHFFQEDEGLMSFTYPYSSTKITRTKDSSNLTTKLYVLTADNENTVSGYNTIMNAEANGSHEDYILNFDYMHERNIITQEQYDAIQPYEAQMREYNIELIKLQQNLSTYQLQKPELEAQVEIYNKSIDLDTENLEQSQSLRNALDIKDGDADGYITIDNNNPDSRIISQEIATGKYYINLTTTNKGIITNTVKIYRGYSTSTHVLSDEQTGFTFHYDEFGRADKIYGIAPTNESYTIYLTYKYNPQLYYDAVTNIWKSKLGSDTKNYQDKLIELGPESINDEDYDLASVYSIYAEKLSLTHQTYDTATTIEKTQVMTAAYNNGLNKKLQDTEEAIENLLDQQQADRKEFERLMGPALREGYWQPEDYQDRGNHLTETKQLSTEDITADSNESFIVGWDNLLFDDEEKNYYEEGVELNKVYYPCINLLYEYNGHTIYDSIKDNIFNYSFIFNNNYLDQDEISANDIRYTQIFSIGSQALLQFGKKNGVIYPLLVLVGAKSMSNGLNPDNELVGIDEIAFMKRNTEGNTKGGNPRLGIVVSHDDGTYTIGDNPIPVAGAFIDASQYETVYPRIKFSSLNLRANSSDFCIFYNNTDMKIAEDYIIQTRNTERDDNYYPEYYITVFPRAIFKGKVFDGDFEVHYVISNADNEIYLDALEVSKENAYPKVEYTVEPTILNHDLSRTLYSKLATLVMINDVQLKLENVFGYISQVELDLDNVSKDQVEVKNYKTKFEDLFSTIVAQTEDMKRDGIAVHAAADGKIALTSDALTKSLIDNDITMYAFLDSYFDSSDYIKDKLESLFTEAGNILSDSGKSLNQIRALSLQNASILSNFAQIVSQELTTKVVQSATKPTNYKPGDIWIDDEGNRYVATSYSSEGEAGGTSGFVRTYNGTIASMTGASLDVNADDGSIAILAENNIDIASADVNIVGNRSVNIGGTQINIGSTGTINGPVGGINLVSTAYNTNNFSEAYSAKVLIHPEEIFMAGAKITLVTGTTQAASAVNAIQLDGTVNTTNPTPGIWIGSGKSVELYSGTGSTGSNVSLTPFHIIMGVVSGNNTSVFELRNDYLIMAVGTSSSDFSANAAANKIAINNQSGSLTGLKLTKDSFGLAIGSNNNRSVMIMDTNGFIVGTGNTPKTSGSYVQISGEGVEIGSLGTLYVNMDNFKLQTDVISGDTVATTRFAVGKGLHNIDATTVAGIGTQQDSFVGLVYNKTGLFVSGRITATEFIATSNRGKFIANGDKFGLYKADETTGILTADNNGNLTAAGDLTISAGKSLSLDVSSGGKIAINSANFKVDSSATGTNAIFYVGTANKYIKYSITNGLQVEGEITATKLTVGNGSVMTYDSTNGLVIGSGNSKLEYKNSVLSVTGGITATTLTVGNTSDSSYMTYNSTNGLIVKGNITANSGIIGAWKVGDSILTSYENNTAVTTNIPQLFTGGHQTYRVTFVAPGVSNYNSNLNNQVNLNKWAMYVGAEWPEDSPNYELFQCPGPLNSNSNIKAIGWAPFRVMRNGETYIKTLCIGNGPSSISSDQYIYASDSYWSGYTGELYFWIEGTYNNQLAYKWIRIDGQRLYNAILRAENNGSAPSGCFVKGTLINLPDGTKIPIEQLKVDMKILAYDQQTNSFVPGRVGVLQQFEHRNCIYDLYLSNNKIITVTHSHPFLTTDGWKAINPNAAMRDHHIQTETLKENDLLVNSTSKQIYIKKIVYREDLQDETVYHCSIDTYHTFLVENVVVHNIAELPDDPDYGYVPDNTSISDGSTISRVPANTSFVASGKH